MKNISRLLTLLLILPGLAACSAPLDQVSDTTATAPVMETPVGKIVIAIIAPLTGPVATFGISTRDGVQMAIDEWNARGGVLGKKVTLVPGDGECDSNAAVSAYNQVVHQQGARYIIGGICSSESLPIAEIAEAQGIVQISPASTMEALTLNDNGSTRQYIFRACYTDSFQGSAAGTFAARTLKARRAYLLVDPADKYTVNLADSFEQSFIQSRGGTVGRGEYSGPDKDFSVVFSRLAAANPDIIYMATSYSQGNRLVSQARKQGIVAPFVSSDGWDSPDLDLSVTEGSYFTTHFSSEDQRAIVQDWVKKYQARFQTVPDAIGALSYDAANLMLAAISKAGVDDPTDVAAAMEGMEWNGITGTIQFNSQHNPIKPVVIMKIEDGKIKYEETLLPE